MNTVPEILDQRQRRQDVLDFAKRHGLGLLCSERLKGRVVVYRFEHGDLVLPFRPQQASA